MAELEYLETHVVDQCNLKCRGCSHFSPIAQNNNYSIAEFKNDINRLSEIFNNIKTFRLLGGEPFIAMNLNEYIITVRDAFPKTDIRIVTNGLLLEKIDKLNLKTIRECNTQLDISLYPPTMDIINDILNFVNKNDLRYNFQGPIVNFWKRITLSGKYNNVLTFERCPSNNCTFLYKGKISACPGPSLCYILNDKFGTKLDGSKDVIEIYASDTTGKKVLEFIKSPLELCKHCGQALEFPWSNHADANLSDWAFDDLN